MTMSCYEFAEFQRVTWDANLCLQSTTSRLFQREQTEPFSYVF